MTEAMHLPGAKMRRREMDNWKLLLFWPVYGLAFYSLEWVFPRAYYRPMYHPLDELPETAVEEFDSLPLKEALRRLPKDLKDVIILRFFGGYTVAETAQTLHIPAGTVATRQRKALQLLRLELEEEVSS